MSDDFDEFNQQVATEPGTEEKSQPQTEHGDDSHETQISNVTVVGDDNDRLKISAETTEGTQVEEELTVAEVGRAMSQLGITDARELEGQPVLAWEEDDGSTHLEFESRLEQ